jgi:hypothetical protein
MQHNAWIPYYSRQPKKNNAKKEHQLKLFFTQHQLNVVRDTNITLWILL